MNRMPESTVRPTNASRPIMARAMITNAWPRSANVAGRRWPAVDDGRSPDRSECSKWGNIFTRPLLVGQDYAHCLLTRVTVRGHRYAAGCGCRVAQSVGRHNRPRQAPAIANVQGAGINGPRVPRTLAHSRRSRAGRRRDGPIHRGRGYARAIADG